MRKIKKKVFFSIFTASLLLKVVAISVSAEEIIYYPYVLFAENTDTNSIQLNMLHLTVNDDITTNDTFSSSVFNSTIISIE